MYVLLTFWPIELGSNQLILSVVALVQSLLYAFFSFFQGFREGRFQVLVATDVAARGLDVPEVDLVIQCEPPKVVSTE